jgi:uncharacterized protein (TIGR03435 family)
MAQSLGPGLAPAAALTMFGQETAPPACELVSVKRSGSTHLVMPGPGTFHSPTRGFRYDSAKVAGDLPLLCFIQEACGVKFWQVQGPDWITFETHDLAPGMADGTTREAAKLGLRTMLKDGCGLKFHREPKELAVYVLVRANGGWKLAVVQRPERSSYGFKPGNAERTVRFEAAPAVPLGGPVSNLSLAAGKPVLDETGLTGFYQIGLAWTRAPGNSTDAGTLTALSKTRLKLDPQKRPFAVLVIDHAEKEPRVN